MATIVGYREDPDLFARALDSYKSAAECRFVLVGVDGDDTPDMEMVHVFKGVNSPTIVYTYRTDVTYRFFQRKQPSSISMSPWAKLP